MNETQTPNLSDLLAPATAAEIAAAGPTGLPLPSEAETLRAQAAAADQEAADSFERCDTDGFLSQWASGLTADKLRRQAQIVENGGMAVFPALFLTYDNSPVPSRLVNTKYGTKFAVFATAADALRHGANVIAWVDPFVSEKTLARKGYKVADVWAPARAEITGSGHGLSGSAWVVTVRTDGGWAADAKLADAESDTKGWTS